MEDKVIKSDKLTSTIKEYQDYINLEKLNESLKTEITLLKQEVLFLTRERNNYKAKYESFSKSVEKLTKDDENFIYQHATAMKLLEKEYEEAKNIISIYEKENINLKNLIQKLKDIPNRVPELEVQIQALQQKYSEVQKLSIEFEEKYSTERSIHSETLSNLTKITKEKSKILSELSLERETVGILTETKKTLEDELNNSKEENKNIRLAISNAEQKNKNLTEEIKTLKKEITNLNKEINLLNTTLNSKNSELKEFKALMVEKNNEIKKITDELYEFKLEAKNAAVPKLSKEELKANADKEMLKLIDEKEQLIKEMKSELKKYKNFYEAKINDPTFSNKSDNEELVSLSNEVKKLKKQLEKEQDNNYSLKQMISTLDPKNLSVLKAELLAKDTTIDERDKQIKDLQIILSERANELAVVQEQLNKSINSSKNNELIIKLESLLNPVYERDKNINVIPVGKDMYMIKNQKFSKETLKRAIELLKDKFNFYLEGKLISIK